MRIGVGVSANGRGFGRCAPELLRAMVAESSGCDSVYLAGHRSAGQIRLTSSKVRKSARATLDGLVEAAT